MSKAYLKHNLILLNPYLTPLTPLTFLRAFKKTGVRTYVRTYGRSDIVTTWAAVAAKKEDNITQTTHKKNVCNRKQK